MGLLHSSRRIDRIASSQHSTGEEFATEVLKAEGFNPYYEVRRHCRINRRFLEPFGNVASADATSDQRFPVNFPASSSSGLAHNKASINFHNEDA
jgi:hypothetical protein